MTSLEAFQLGRQTSLLLVVDVQQKLAPAMPQKVFRDVLRTIEFLTKSMEVLGVPVTATEQYPKGLGPTVPELAEACRASTLTKMTFGCCGEATFLDHLKTFGKKQILVTGMEAHVCVWQTVLGLREAGFQVHLIRDAVISRGKSDYLNALELARQTGAVVTTAETAVFQLLQTAAAQEFKAISALVKERSAG